LLVLLPVLAAAGSGLATTVLLGAAFVVFSGTAGPVTGGSSAPRTELFPADSDTAGLTSGELSLP
jgi:hypothetical protein